MFIRKVIFTSSLENLIKRVKKGGNLMRTNKFIKIGLFLILGLVLLTGCGNSGPKQLRLVIQWSVMNSGTTEDLKSIWGNPFTDNLYAVGSNGKILSYHAGSSWQPMESGTTMNLNAIWGLSNDTLYAVGDYDSSFSKATILKYNGTGWSPMSNKALPDAHLYGVAGDSENYFVVAGHNTLGICKNGSWTFETITGADYYGLQVQFMSDVALHSVAVGTISATEGIRNVTKSNDYISWNNIDNASYNTYKLNSVFRGELYEYFYAGDSGVILHSDYNYNDWSKIDSGVTENLNALWAYEISGSINCTYIVAVGDNGTILLNDGTTCEKLNGGTTQNLNGIYKIGFDYYIVGDQGVILHGHERYQ